jgi:hypothetical protein
MPPPSRSSSILSDSPTIWRLPPALGRRFPNHIPTSRRPRVDCPVVGVEGREARVFTAFNSSIQPSAAAFSLNFARQPVPSGANQYLVPAARLTGGTGMVFHAAFWNMVELPPSDARRDVRYCPFIVRQTSSSRWWRSRHEGSGRQSSIARGRHLVALSAIPSYKPFASLSHR